MSGKRNEVPAGFFHKPVETAAGGVRYGLEVLQAESLQAWLDLWESEGKNPHEVACAILNASQEQGAKQGPKDPVRKAETEEARNAAIADAQETARFFLIGAPRGGGGARHETGLTKKQREDFGSAVTLFAMNNGKFPSPKEQAEIAVGLDIDPAVFGL